ncbi:TetR/AcrR family transcriptional regulator [Streptomyces sp. bgisy034]|uniref:TetR/AcrR family transcriptional regulator n=1 Tax=Streptomyces sp. bgisy034 TaxID=3413774 RepID=UPI003EB74587
MAKVHRSTRDGDGTRAKIVAAASELLPRFTIAKITMEDVARASGMARQTVYKHFRSKDELIAELIAQELRARHAPLMRKLARRKPTARGFAELFLAQLATGQAFPLAAPVLDPQIAPRMAELIFGADVVLETLEQIWAPVLDRYAEAGLLRAGLDRGMTVRWLTYQQFWLITHPGVLASDEGQLKAYVESFIVPGIISPAPGA